MERPSFDKIFMETCKIYASRSSCPRRGFGAVIVSKDNRVLSTGYNGNWHEGGPNLCGGDHCSRDSEGITSGTMYEIGCVHAEMGAILNAARNGVPIKGATLYVNGEPCVHCAKMITLSGIDEVKILGPIGEYGGAEILKEANVSVQNI